jgi:NitT/TauT family transport system permease protein
MATTPAALPAPPGTLGVAAPAPAPEWWVDAVVLLGLGALIGGVVSLAHRWNVPLRQSIEIDLSASALPLYTALSLARGVIAYIISLTFTLVYGTIAAHNQRAERVMIPIIDILQGIPVLGFLPGLVLGLVALFPHSNIGLELASVLLVFTGQVWNMTFSFYGSLRGIPSDFRDVAWINGFGWWKTFRTLELPSATIGLLWNSMMSMAGGWFFLTVTEAFTLGSRDFRLPGIGAYMAVAIDRGDRRAMAYAVVAMIVMIVSVDQLVWRPALAWAQKFKVEETAAADVPRSFLLDLLRRSRMLAWIERQGGRLLAPSSRRRTRAPGGGDPALRRRITSIAGWSVAIAGLMLAGWGATHLALLVATLGPREWLTLAGALGLTFLRTSATLVLGAAWAVPVGVWIGISPRRARLFQEPVQVAAAFPAPMLYPLVTMGLLAAGIPFSWGCVVLMLLGAQWYILFNVLAGASAMPQDLREAADTYGLGGWSRWRTLYLPAIFPHLVTGLITAAGGAWNASIVAEYVHYGGRTLVAPGLGSLITQASESAHFALLAAGVLTMSLALIVINRNVWRRLYRLADERFSLNR